MDGLTGGRGTENAETGRERERGRDERSPKKRCSQKKEDMKNMKEEELIDRERDAKKAQDTERERESVKKERKIERKKERKKERTKERKNERKKDRNKNNGPEVEEIDFSLKEGNMEEFAWPSMKKTFWIIRSSSAVKS